MATTIITGQGRPGIIIVTGTPGAGKTTVLDKSLGKLAGQISRVNYGDIMFEIAKERGVRNRDDMRKLPLHEQRAIQTAAANRIKAQSETSKKLVIVDTHSTIKTSHGYIPGMPEWVIKSLQPSVIVLIETDPKQIAKRRSKDKSRSRDSESVQEIQLQQDLNRMFASAYAAMTGASVKVIMNPDKKLGTAVNELIKIIEDML